MEKKGFAIRIEQKPTKAMPNTDGFLSAVETVTVGAKTKRYPLASSPESVFTWNSWQEAKSFARSNLVPQPFVTTWAVVDAETETEVFTWSQTSLQNAAKNA